jgi:hypothetical protein
MYNTENYIKGIVKVAGIDMMLIPNFMYPKLVMGYRYKDMITQEVFPYKIDSDVQQHAYLLHSCTLYGSSFHGISYYILL